MFHSSVSRRRSTSPKSRVWSHNTGYTGVAGIHSEVGTGAQARNHLMERRSSNHLTAEEDIMRKEMKALQANRKSMEKSMLLYTQKMKDISERKSINFRKSPLPFQTTKLQTSPKHQLNNNKPAGIFLPTTLPSIASNAIREEAVHDDYSTFSDRSSNQNTGRKPESRMSFDSGFGSIDSHRDSVTSHDHSPSHKDVHNKSTPLSHRESSTNEPENNDTRPRGRARERKRFRDSKTFKLATVVDSEIKENDEPQGSEQAEEEIETPRIIPFPDDLLYNDLSISSLALASIMEYDDPTLQDSYENRVANPIVGRRNLKNGNGRSRVKSKTPYVLFRPKVSNSPSLAALRHRFVRRFGPNSIYFRYSEEVLAALRSLSNSPNRQKSGKSFQSLSPPPKSCRSVSPSKKSPSISPSLHGIDLDELLDAHSARPGGLFRLFMEEEGPEEFFLTKDQLKLPRLIREKSFSAPSSKTPRISLVSKLDQVEENDNSMLKSVLKKDDAQFSNEKKNVQFFLPDIFMQANVCTSQPQEFR